MSDYEPLYAAHAAALWAGLSPLLERRIDAIVDDAIEKSRTDALSADRARLVIELISELRRIAVDLKRDLNETAVDQDVPHGTK